MPPQRTNTDGDVRARTKNLSHPRSFLRGIGHQISGNKPAILTVLVFSLGCILDHLTTVYGVSLSNIAESNPVVLRLMEFGVWSMTEVLVILMGTILGVTICRAEESKLKDFSMTVLATVGFTRFIAAFNNFALIIKAMY